MARLLLTSNPLCVLRSPVSRPKGRTPSPSSCPSRCGRPTAAWPRSLPFHAKAFGPGARVDGPALMTEEVARPQFREHLHKLREALGGIGKDVEVGVADAPHLAKEGTKDALARAAGVRRTPMREWAEPRSKDRP